MSTLQQMFEEELRQATETSSRGLLEGFERNKLEESLFRQHFLPFFTNSVAPSPDNPVYAYWVGVAGSPTSEVDIVDSTGNYLFTVPALLNTNSLEVLQNRHRGPSVKDMYLEYAQMSQGLAPVATNVWNKGLYDKMKDIITSDNPASQSDREKWNKIFAYYNIHVNVVTESNTNETNEAPLEYE
jgi:hypothetical protein